MDGFPCESSTRKKRCGPVGISRPRCRRRRQRSPARFPTACGRPPRRSADAARRPAGVHRPGRVHSAPGVRSVRRRRFTAVVRLAKAKASRAPVRHHALPVFPAATPVTTPAGAGAPDATRPAGSSASPDRLPVRGRRLPETFEIQRRQVAQRGMTPPRVVPPFDEREHRRPRLGVRRPLRAVEQLALQRREEALGHRVVEAVADRTHRRRHAPFLTAGAEGQRRVLAALVGVMDHRRRSALLHGHLQRFGHQRRAQVRCHRPTHDPPAEHVEDDGQHRGSRPASGRT